METDLLGDPLPEPLPANVRLVSEFQLIGHTIRAVYLETSGTYGHAHLVLVTTTGCWMVFQADDDGNDITLDVERPYSGSTVQLTGYVKASELERDDAVSPPELARLKQIESIENAASLERRKNHLRAQLRSLEGGA